MVKAELKALMDFWFERMNRDDIPVKARTYATGYYHGLRDVWRTLYGEEGFSLKEWVEMEGQDGVDWP